jgi:hypothetical protein
MRLRTGTSQTTGADGPANGLLLPERKELKGLLGPEGEAMGAVTSQDVRLEIKRKRKCALHSCIENLGNFHAF